MTRVSPLLAAPLVVALGLGGLFLWGMSRDDPGRLPSALEGRLAASVNLTPLGAGAPFTDADLKDGKVKIVNFWASWCAPCRAEHPNLQALAAEGVAILGVNYKDQPDGALAFLAELGNPFSRMGADANGRMGIDWGLYGVPESFVIDGQGRVVTRFPGPITERALKDEIRPALEKAAAGQ
jgi:cytochrome c biogenesis protein CcmG/thiol:disulfide interchange protein DsbE